MIVGLLTHTGNEPDVILGQTGPAVQRVAMARIAAFYRPAQLPFPVLPHEERTDEAVAEWFERLERYDEVPHLELLTEDEVLRTYE